jgi:hypothetical protein
VAAAGRSAAGSEWAENVIELLPNRAGAQASAAGAATGLNFAMFARTLSLLLLVTLCACAPTAPVTMPDQPELVQAVLPYVDSFRALGITRITSPGNGAMLRLETGYGDVYVRYPAGMQPMAFVVDIAPKSLRVRSEDVDRVRFGELFAEFAPEVTRVTAANNVFGWNRANPVR